MLVHTATTTHLEGLERVRRRGLRVRLDRAEHAPPRARVPQEHDRARAAVPALADVRAPRLLAHGVQVQSRQALPHARVARRRRVEGRRRDAEPRRSSHGHGCSHLRSDHGSVVVVVVVVAVSSTVENMADECFWRRSRSATAGCFVDGNDDDDNDDDIVERRTGGDNWKDRTSTTTAEAAAMATRVRRCWRGHMMVGWASTVVGAV